MIGHSCDNGRCGGGSGGNESRYHFPAVDDARWDEAKEGKTDTSPLHGEMPERIAAATANTMSGGRGRIEGASLPKDRGGFC